MGSFLIMLREEYPFFGMLINDTIIFVDHNIEKALNMKLILVYSSSFRG
jgi:hypothetical protein